MKKIYYLSTCSTCLRIMKELGVDDRWQQKDIKRDPILANELLSIAKFVGSYRALFSKRALKYRSMGLHERELSENDMKDLILSEYTFLKRPVIQLDDKFYIGNAKHVINSAKDHLNG